MDYKGRAYAIERRYRMLTTPWVEMLVEIRSERGALLGATQYDELAGVEEVTALDQIDTRLKVAEDWLIHYKKERTAGVGFRVRRWLRQAILMSDTELEGIV